jgi:hypothetical protein
MTPTITDWTVVLVGQWNPAIFSPQWIGQNLLHTPEVEMHLAFGAQSNAVRFQSQTLIVIPQADKLIIGARNIEEPTLREIETVAINVLQLLGHTPVKGVGINFGFNEPDPAAEMLQTFNLHDSGALADEGHNVQETQIIRQIPIQGGVLNLKLSHRAGVVDFHFNYSHSVNNAGEAANYLQNRVLQHRAQTMQILMNVFHLEAQEVH